MGQRADVLNVRLGWVFRDGWITDERAWWLRWHRSYAGRVARGGP